MRGLRLGAVWALAGRSTIPAAMARRSARMGVNFLKVMGLPSMGWMQTTVEFTETFCAVKVNLMRGGTGCRWRRGAIVRGPRRQASGDRHGRESHAAFAIRWPFRYDSKMCPGEIPGLS